MDAESFLAAQLWLHALHPDAWPVEGSPTVATGAAAAAEAAANQHIGNDLDRVILSDARCCLLLNDDIATANQRNRRLRFSARNARQSRERAASFRGNSAGVRVRGQGMEDQDGIRNGRGESQRPEDEEVDSTGEFDFGLAIVQGLVPPSGGDRAGAAAETDIGGDCAAKEAVPTPRKNACRPRDNGNGSSSNSRDRRVGILLLRIDGRVYQAEHTLIRRIAYPRDGGMSTGGDVADSRVRDEEKPEQTGNRHIEGGSGAAIPRERSSASRRDMFAGGAASQVDPLKGVSGCSSGSWKTVGRRSSLLSKAVMTTTFSDRPETARGIDAVVGVGSKKRRLGAAGVDGMDDVMRGSEEGRGCAGGSGQSACRRRFKRGVSPAGNWEDDVRGRAAEGERRRETADCDRRDCDGCNCRGGGDVAVANSGDELEDGKGGMLDDGDSSEETPFCGLLFPGVFLMFWLPRHLGHYPHRPSGMDARAEAIKRMQRVVTDMMRGLSSSSRVHLLAYGSARQGAIPPNLSVSELGARELGLDGLRSRGDAWDEFVYGSHVVLRLERAEVDEQAGDQIEDARRGAYPAVANASRERSSGLNDGGGKSTAAPPSPWSGDAGKTGSPCLGEPGRCSALSTLAECLSRARVPPAVRSSLQRQLREAEISADRSLEDALDRAFPLHISLGKESEARASKVAELEACRARARSAREALLQLALLPAPEMLREANSDGL